MVHSATTGDSYNTVSECTRTADLSALHCSTQPTQSNTTGLHSSVQSDRRKHFYNIHIHMSMIKLILQKLIYNNSVKHLSMQVIYESKIKIAWYQLVICMDWFPTSDFNHYKWIILGFWTVGWTKLVTAVCGWCGFSSVKGGEAWGLKCLVQMQMSF